MSGFNFDTEFTERIDGDKLEDFEHTNPWRTSDTSRHYIVLHTSLSKEDTKEYLLKNVLKMPLSSFSIDKIVDSKEYEDCYYIEYSWTLYIN